MQIYANPCKFMPFQATKGMVDESTAERPYRRRFVPTR